MIKIQIMTANLMAGVYSRRLRQILTLISSIALAVVQYKKPKFRRPSSSAKGFAKNLPKNENSGSKFDLSVVQFYLVTVTLLLRSTRLLETKKPELAK